MHSITRPLLVFCVSAAWLALTMDRELNLYDEGLVLTGAMRVAAGEVPHRDFYTNYGPAQFYILAALFKLFGQSVLIERAWDVLVRASIVVVCYMLAATYCRTAIVIAVTAACALWMAALPFYAYPLFPALLFSLLSAAFTVKALLFVPAARWPMVGAGAMVGVVALFRYDVGFFVFVVLGCGIAAATALNRTSRTLDLAPAARLLLPYALGTAAVFGLPALLYVATSPIAPFVHDLFLFPQTYARTRSLPFPTLTQAITSVANWPIYLPLLIFTGAISTVSYRHWKGGLGSPQSWRCDLLLLVLALLGIAFYLKGVVRVSTVHMLGAIVVAVVIIGVLLERALAAKTLVVLAAVGGVLLAISTLAEWIGSTKWRQAHGSAVYARLLVKFAPWIAPPATRAPTTPQPPEPLAGFLTSTEQFEVVRLLADHTRPDERIFVGLGRHDRIFVNDNLMYFAVQRMPATRWHHFDPGLQTSAPVQREIVSELERHRVRYIVLNSRWEHVREQNESSVSSGVHVLDDYIRDHFQKIGSCGPLTVLVRRSKDEGFDGGTPRMQQCESDAP